MTAIEWLHQWDPAAVTEELRGILGQMLFARDEATKSTNVLSGGEAARLLFCKLMLQKPNVLILDEPTNHLDLESINALNIALQRYQGTVLLVTHDHDLIDEVATASGTSKAITRSLISRVRTRSISRPRLRCEYSEEPRYRIGCENQRASLDCAADGGCACIICPLHHFRCM